MADFVIFTDSTSDLGKDMRDKYNIEYVYMNVNVNEKEYIADLDWKEFSPKEFYDWMRKGAKVYTTQVSISEFINKFSSALEQGKDVLYLSVSSKLSGSINTALNVKNELLEKYPDRKIICIDTLRATLGEGLIAIRKHN